MKIKTDKGRTFFVRVVKLGEKWGRNDCLTHDHVDPLIEFYDPSESNQRDYFICNYYADTLAEHTDGVGLALFGGSPEFDIDSATLAPVIALAREIRVQHK